MLRTSGASGQHLGLRKITPENDSTDQSTGKIRQLLNIHCRQRLDQPNVRGISGRVRVEAKDPALRHLEHPLSIISIRPAHRDGGVSRLEIASDFQFW